jgi:hypothetical protein
MMASISTGRCNKTKRSFILPVFLILISQTTFAQEAPVLEWARAYGGPQDNVRTLATDALGNTYITGRFFDTQDFDPGPSVFNLTSLYADDAFIIKLNSDGNFVWAKAWGGVQDCYTGRIYADPSGNVYVTGSFGGTIDFDPSAAVSQLTSAGSFSDIFISKFDTNGNFLWAKSLGGTSNESLSGILTDATGNIYIAGSFNGSADFDPGAGNAFLSSVGQSDIFVAKLDINGSFVWAKQMGGGSYDGASSIGIDLSGNIYTTGFYMTTADFDPSAAVFNLTSTGERDIFISKLENDGDFVWAKSIGGSDFDLGYDVVIDASENVITTGRFFSTVDFDPGASAFNLTTVSALPDAFISKLDKNGNFLWAKAMGGSSIDYGTGLSADASGNIYTTGLFQGTSDFDPGSSTFNMSSIGGYDIFISKLDADGDFVWATHIAGAGGGSITSDIAVDPLGGIYTAGNYNGNADVDPGGCTFNLAGGSNFIQKLSIGTVGSGPIAEITLNGTTLTSSSGDSYQWYLNGEEVSEATSQSFELNTLEYGVYRVDVTGGGCTATSADYIYLITASELENHGYKVYPNPFVSTITIESSTTEKSEVRIVDALGRTIKTYWFQSGTSLKLDNLSSGAYVLSVSTKSKKLFFKLLKM